jgi:lipopolysaccharide biosynthesis regulator YciM
MITPVKIEQRLYELSKEIDISHGELINAENEYHVSKAAFEISMAKSRMKNSHIDMKMTAVQREDQALIENSEAHMKLAIAEATVKAARGNVTRIRTQVDIARSIGTSVRTSLEM